MKKRKSLVIILCLLFCLVITGCKAGNQKDASFNSISTFMPGESYLELNEQPFINTSDNNHLNISMDSSTAGYSNIRRLINNEQEIPHDAVNIEQMINYFNYDLVNDTDKALKTFTEISQCPWNSENKLLSVAIKAKDYEEVSHKPNNFVFLLDVSGSMYSSDKLPLMIEAFKILIDNLHDNVRISIVTYASSDEVLLDGGFGYEKTKISAIISDLVADGATNGSQGIETAYHLAQKYYLEGGNNRIFLATDGDFNVGISSTKDLKNFISKKRDMGIYLSLFGFGMGNYHASTMDTLAGAGNGNAYYIDSVLEAQKIFMSELGGTLNTVAKDCKAQIEFNRDIVDSYRIIGYENKILSDDEFNDSKTDAGEIGAGHTTICLVELKMKEVKTSEILRCTVRYKIPGKEINEELITICKEINESPSNNFIFASAVAEFGLVLRDSKYKGSADCNAILNRINKDTFAKDIYKKEFIELIKKYLEYNKK